MESSKPALVEITQPALLREKNPSESRGGNIFNVSQAAHPAGERPEEAFLRIAEVFGQLAVNQAREPILPKGGVTEDLLQP